MCAASSTLLEKQCLIIAQRLVSHCKIPVPELKSIADIDCNLIVLLFENITNLNIPDLFHCENKIEEAHNVQAVIDTLSLDLLGISLSHITGEDVVAGNIVAIRNLLEVLEGVSMYLTSSDQNEKSQGHLMKRKVFRKRKSRLLFSNQNSSSITGASVNISTDTSNRDEIDDRNSKQHDSTNYQSLKMKKSRFERHKASKCIYRNKKHFTSEHLVKNSGKPAPQTCSRANVPCSQNRTRAAVQQLDDDMFHGEKISERKTKMISLPYSRCEKDQMKTKSHFNFEENVHNNKQGIQYEGTSSPKIIKRKTTKIRPLKPVEKGPDVEELYEKNLENKIRVLLEKNSTHKPRAEHMKKVRLQTIKKPIQRSPISACKKSFLLPYALRHHSISRTAPRRVSPRRTQFSKTSQQQNDKDQQGKSKPGFIQELLDEFPGLQLTPKIVNHITKKYQKHLMNMHKQAKNCLLKKPKSQMQAEEAARKQTALSNILKKDILQEQHLKKLREDKKFENAIRFHLRDARLQSAKMKQYCDEFNTEMRKKMQKRNFTEELVFEKVFMDALKIQKDQVDRLCEEVKATSENDAQKHLTYLEALENLYQSQFSLLSETLASEKRNTEDKLKAEKQVINSMQKEFREELKKEIRFMQRAIIECLEDTEFRKLDAEQYTMKLRDRFS